MSYIGDFRLGDTVDFKFCTVQSTGAPTTLSGSPVISAYPANSTTELTAGITLTVDFDARTGLNHVRVAATGGNGYLTATNYEMVITTGTVNSVSAVGYVVGTFSIENRSALMPTTEGRTLVVSSAGVADAQMVLVGPSGSGTAQTARDIGASVLLSNGTGTGQLAFSSGVVQSNVVQLNSVTASATNLERSASVIYRGSVTGAASTTTLIDSSLTQASNDHWKGRIVIFTSGSLQYQATDITAFTASTHQLTFSALTGSPSAADTYVIV